MGRLGAFVMDGLDEYMAIMLVSTKLLLVGLI